MWALPIILYAILPIICTVITFAEKRFVSSGLATTVGIPDMRTDERENFRQPYWIKQQWEIAAPFIYNYVVYKARNRPLATEYIIFNISRVREIEIVLQ